jgi:predicted NBD/HSP70 family sugar kinase
MTEVIEEFRNISIDAKKILGIVQKNGPLTKAQILNITNLKLTTLNRIIKPIIDNKLIIEVSIGESTGGRKPSLYDVNNNYVFIGIDISRIYTQVVFTDLKLNVIYKERFNMDSSYSPEKTVNKIKQICIDGIKKLKLKKANIVLAGLGTVGPMDLEKGLIKNPINFMSSGWENVAIKEMLQEALELEIYMDNGANSAVTAEYLFGSGKAFKNIAYFNFGRGIRTGVISNGNIIRVINDTEDAFAHMTIDFDGEKCSCGNYGCVECYSSIMAITKKFKEEIKNLKKNTIGKPIKDINYVDICLAAEKGDELAYKIILEAAKVFGTALANFINLLNPEVVVLSGPLMMVSNLFYNVSYKTAKERCYFSNHANIFFYKGGYFKENAISVGAVAIAIEKLIL